MHADHNIDERSQPWNILVCDSPETTEDGRCRCTTALHCIQINFHNEMCNDF